MEHVRRAVRTWRGCVVAQRGARSSPRRWPGIDRTNTTTGRRHAVRKVALIAFKPRGAHPARFSLREVRADRPRSMPRKPCSADLAWLCCGALKQRRARSSVPCRPKLDRTSTAIGRWHRLRKAVSIAFEYGDVWPARFSAHGVSATAHAAREPRCADLAWLCCDPTRGALVRTLPVDTRPRKQRQWSAAQGSKGRKNHV